MSLNNPVSRRKFLKSSALLLGAAAVPLVGSRTAAAAKPQLQQDCRSAMLWPTGR
jgi:hypothetical protein